MALGFLENIIKHYGIEIMIQLKWHKEIPDNILEIESIVKQDLSKVNDDLEGKCSNLIFHHVFLTDDYDGPLVIVWGEEGDNDFYHCEYDPKPNWSSIKEWNDSEDLSLDKT